MLPQGAGDFPDLLRFFSKNHSQNVVDVSILRKFALNAVARCGNEMRQQGLNVFEVIYAFDPKDHKAIPLLRVAVLEMPADAAEQVSGETNVVQLGAMIERVDARISPHDPLCWQTGRSTTRSAKLPRAVL